MEICNEDKQQTRDWTVVKEPGILLTQSKDTKTSYRSSDNLFARGDGSSSYLEHYIVLSMISKKRTQSGTKSVWLEIFQETIGSLNKQRRFWECMSTTSKAFSLLLRINPTKFIWLGAFILELLTRRFAQEIWANQCPRMQKVHKKLTCITQKCLC